jgi:dihydrodipicolinate synthase/N-acetylneuraminate lyase
MNRPTTLAGVLPVFQTPYGDDESIDVATLGREIDWLFENGADGIVMAMVSEVLRLSTGERESLAKNACLSAKGRGPVIISVGSESSVVSEALARHAEGCGAAAVMAIPPVTVAAEESQLKRYYQRIVRAIKIPVIVQDASGYVGRPMPLLMQAELLNEFGEDRILFKPEAVPIGPRLSALRDMTGGKAKIFEGTGGIALIDSYRRGIAGTMPGADLIKGIVALWRALKDRNDERAYRISQPVSSLIAMQNSLDAFLAIEKYLLVKQGIFKNTLIRGPVGYVLDEETRLEVDRLFKRMTQAVEAA